MANTPTYKIQATVTEVNADYFKIKGVKEYLFTDSKKKIWNIFESMNKNNPHELFKISHDIKFKNGNSKYLFMNNILALSFVQKNALIFEMEIDQSNNKITLISISHPNA